MSLFPILEFAAQETRSEAFIPWTGGSSARLEDNDYFQQAYYYLRHDEHGIFCGHALLKAYDAAIPDFPVELFLVVQAGEIVIQDQQGRQTRLAVGDSAVIPRGLTAHWRQSAGTRIHFFLHDGRGEPQAAAPATAQQVIVPDLRATLDAIDGPAPELITSSPPPRVGRKVIYASASGRFSVGLWEASAYTRSLAGFKDYELMHFVQGNVRITNAIGESRVFKAGETFLVGRATSNAWHTDDYVRKVYAKITP